MRRLPAVVGGLLVLAAVALSLLSGRAGAPPMAVTAGIVFVAGLLATLALAAAVGHREPAAFEASAAGHPAPGDDVDALLADLSAAGRRDPSPDRERLRERLESAAVPVVARRFDCSPAAARDLLTAGDWTDDPVAAAYFRDDDVSRGAHLRSLATGDPPTRRRARRVIDELHRLDGDGGGDEESRDSDRSGTEVTP